jgi:DNA mismatch endonuclease (patch repair protein)
MADVFSRKKRSLVMSTIRSRDTLPEIDVRRFLWSRGFRYRLHVSRLPGRPDIYLKEYCAAILVNGCFWHQHRNCRFAVTPKSNTEFWKRKLRGNILRDRKVGRQLHRAGIRVLTVWECSLETGRRIRTFNRMERWLLSQKRYAEI